MKYDNAIEWLYGTQLFGIKLGLENVSKLLRLLEIEPDSPGVRIVHVAGTNGKGSVCAFTEKILRDAGLKVGLFTSPHLVSFRERIQVCGEMIPEGAVAESLADIRNRVEDWDIHPTFFEIALAVAMKHFRESGCEIVVLETGMGGRLDATNSLKAEVSVITPISLDHQQWLGETLREVAKEKAGIIKPETPVVVADLHPDARDVVGRRALSLHVPYIEVHPIPEEWPLGLPGPHQRENAALAVEAACRVGGDHLTQEGIQKSLASTEWPGRFQIIDNRIVLDGAHNPDAGKALTATWLEKFGADEKATIIYSAVSSKDVAGTLEHLATIAERFCFVPVKSERKLSTEELEDALEKAGGKDIPTVSFQTLRNALEHAEEHPEKILIAGSLFLVGEALGYLKRLPFEVSEQ